MMKRRTREQIIYDWLCVYGVQGYIKERYPSVEKITVKYCQKYGCFSSSPEPPNHSVVLDKVMEKTPESNAQFWFECINHECTEVMYNMNKVVEDMLRHKESSRSGKIECKGKTAPDHPYQRCGAALYYEIEIVFKKS